MPEGWAWCRLRVFCPYGDCEKHETTAISDDSWILDLEDIEKNTGRILSYATKLERNAVSTKHRFYKGQVLYSKLRPYLNKVVIAPKDGYCTSEILPLKLYGQILPKYIQLFLMSSTFLSYVNMISYGVKMPRLGTEDGKKALIALPPLREQMRIAEKYDYIIPMILELQSSGEELASSITTIKSKILDLAIRGKLVPQDHDDEPASVLLERIRTEKEELIKQGKIKRDKKESVIFKGEDNSYYLIQNGKSTPADETIVFDLPESWIWTTLPTIANMELGKTLDRAKNTGTLYPYLRSVNVQWGDIDLSNLNEMRFEDDELEKYSVVKNDLLICEGGDVGRCCVWNSDEDFLYQNALHRARMYANIEPKFYQYVLMSYESKGILKRISNGVTIKHLTGTTLSFMPVPLPPYAEQLRIIKTIEILFAQLAAIAESLN